jgi:hypothetical protein
MTGHKYYYNAETKKSTYTRPEAPPAVPVPPSQDFIPLSEPSEDYTPPSRPPPAQNSFSHSTQDYISLSDPPIGAVPTYPYGAPPYSPFNHARGPFNVGAPFGSISRSNWQQDRRKPQDRPKHRYKITACAPWVLVQTKLGRRFVHNTETGESLWKFPEHVMKAVVEWDVGRMKEKERKEEGESTLVEDEDQQASVQEDPGDEDVPPRIVKAAPVAEEDELASDEEYEEIEVTDDEADEAGEGGPPKKQRTEDPPDDQPMEFAEDDIAWQLQAMEQDGYDDDGMEEDGDWEGEPEIQLSEDDSIGLFRDLLDDFSINPYRTWDQIVDEGRIIEDNRYTVLPNMRSRKDAFSAWSRDKIQALREQREREVQKDPRIPYMAFLSQHASPKLYWPEFKRKYRKDAEMKDGKVADKDREKWYREYVKRVQLPESTLKSDLSALLKAQPLSVLNRATLLDSLPSGVLTDLRYVSLRPDVRDPLIEAYISTLGPPPESRDVETDEAQKKDRERREKALAERERSVRDAKRKQERDLAFGKDRLRAEEQELERAMKVDKTGLKGQLDAGDEQMQ